MWVEGLGLKVAIVEFRVQGSRFGVEGRGYRAQGSGFRVDLDVGGSPHWLHSDRHVVQRL